jgi:hypothetical protein
MGSPGSRVGQGLVAVPVFNSTSIHFPIGRDFAEMYGTRGVIRHGAVRSLSGRELSNLSSNSEVSPFKATNFYLPIILLLHTVILCWLSSCSSRGCHESDPSRRHLLRLITLPSTRFDCLLNLRLYYLGISVGSCQIQLHTDPTTAGTSNHTACLLD